MSRQLRALVLAAAVAVTLAAVSGCDLLPARPRSTASGSARRAASAALASCSRPRPRRREPTSRLAASTARPGDGCSCSALRPAPRSAPAPRLPRPDDRARLPGRAAARCLHFQRPGYSQRTHAATGRSPRRTGAGGDPAASAGESGEPATTPRCRRPSTPMRPIGTAMAGRVASVRRTAGGESRHGAREVLAIVGAARSPAAVGQPRRHHGPGHRGAGCLAGTPRGSGTVERRRDQVRAQPTRRERNRRADRQRLVEHSSGNFALSRLR